MGIFEKQRVFITGGFGFIGSFLTRRLLKEGALIFLLKREEARVERLADCLSQVKLVRGSLLNRVKLKKDLGKIKPAYIFHLASFGGHHSESEVEEILKVNFWGTFNLLEAVKELSFKAFINTGSSSEYGFKKKPMRESDFLEPNSLYAVSKASATYLCQLYARMFGKNIITLRPFTVYGPGDNSDKFIPTAIKAQFLGETLNLVSGTSRHDYIYIDDLIEGYLKAATTSGIAGEVFNLGTGKQYTNEEIVRFIEKAGGKKIKIKKGAYPKHKWDSSFWKADISKAKKLLGWEPKIGVEEGIRRIVKKRSLLIKGENKRILSLNSYQ